MCFFRQTIYSHLHLHLYIFIYIQIYIYTFTYTFSFTYTYIHKYTYIHLRKEGQIMFLSHAFLLEPFAYVLLLFGVAILLSLFHLNLYSLSFSSFYLHSLLFTPSLHSTLQEWDGLLRIVFSRKNKTLAAEFRSKVG